MKSDSGLEFSAIMVLLSQLKTKHDISLPLVTLISAFTRKNKYKNCFFVQSNYNFSKYGLKVPDFPETDSPKPSARLTASKQLNLSLRVNLN